MKRKTTTRRKANTRRNATRGRRPDMTPAFPGPDLVDIDLLLGKRYGIY